VDLLPDAPLLRKSGRAWDRTRDLCICSQKLEPLDPEEVPCQTYLTVLYISDIGCLISYICKLIININNLIKSNIFCKI
jgi:hypothetical protein